MLRQVVLDTETTGIEPELGHRIIEIGCVELVNRRPTGNVFHEYIQPDREIDQGAFEVHGISNEFLADKPRFADIAPKFIEYIRGAQLVIHNAAFDVGFMDAEFRRLNPNGPVTKDLCGDALDSLKLARENARDNAIPWTRYVRHSVSTIPVANCMGLCWTRNCWRRST